MSYDYPINIVLVEPEIPGNTGSIGRLCVGLGASLTLVEPLGFSLEDKYLRRAGLDYWPDLALRVLPDFAAFLRESEGCGRRFFFTTKTERAYTQARFKKGDFLIFGKETKGLDTAILEDNEPYCLTIPMYGPIRSHNLAISVGIAAYEANRQIRTT